MSQMEKKMSLRTCVGLALVGLVLMYPAWLAGEWLAHRVAAAAFVK